jgi:hypothetical protein
MLILDAPGRDAFGRDALGRYALGRDAYITSISINIRDAIYIYEMLIASRCL